MLDNGPHLSPWDVLSAADPRPRPQISVRTMPKDVGMQSYVAGAGNHCYVRRWCILSLSPDGADLRPLQWDCRPDSEEVIKQA